MASLWVHRQLLQWESQSSHSLYAVEIPFSRFAWRTLDCMKLRTPRKLADFHFSIPRLITKSPKLRFRHVAFSSWRMYNSNTNACTSIHHQRSPPDTGTCKSRACYDTLLPSGICETHSSTRPPIMVIVNLELESKFPNKLGFITQFRPPGSPSLIPMNSSVIQDLL